jgi:hypothetical protein
MNDILDYIFNNMKKLDNCQDRIIRVLNRHRKWNQYLNSATVILCVISIIQEYRLCEARTNIENLDRRIRLLEDELCETNADKEV